MAKDINKERDGSIDFARALGLLLIILSHAQPPIYLGQIRSFDVPLMVFVSGLCCFGKNINNYKEYLWHRTKRLVTPVWLFFIIYIPLLILGTKTGIVYPGYVTPQRIFESFLFLEGFGYVWIIRVFLLIMLVTPVLILINTKLNNWLKFVIGLILLLILLTSIIELSNKHSIQNHFFADYIINQCLVYVIAYSILFLLGIRIKESRYRIKYRIIVTISATIIILISAVVLYYVTGDLIISPLYKFPPQSYYVIFGSCMCAILWANIIYLKKIYNWKPLQFIGRNTIWIYLWHIPYVFLLTETFIIIDKWYVRYVIILFFAITTYILQYKIVKRYIPKKFHYMLIG